MHTLVICPESACEYTFIMQALFFQIYHVVHVQALADSEAEYTAERARLNAEVARLERDLAGLQRERADEDRHLRAAVLESQAAAERAESRCCHDAGGSLA